MTKLYRLGTWCLKCDEERWKYVGLCPVCGADYPNGGLDRYAKIEEVWAERKFRLFHPGTWTGGYWTKRRVD